MLYLAICNGSNGGNEHDDDRMEIFRISEEVFNTSLNTCTFLPDEDLIENHLSYNVVNGEQGIGDHNILLAGECILIKGEVPKP